jgi:glycyl-tRNA synthetase
MEELSKGELFPKVVEAYSRPTRIVRGKEIEFHTEVIFPPLFLSIASL